MNLVIKNKLWGFILNKTKLKISSHVWHWVYLNTWNFIANNYYFDPNMTLLDEEIRFRFIIYHS